MILTSALGGTLSNLDDIPIKVTTAKMTPSSEHIHWYVLAKTGGSGSMTYISGWGELTGFEVDQMNNANAW